MKTLFLTCIVVLTSLAAKAQNSMNMVLLSHYNDSTLTGREGQVWNDVMGWKDTVKNREYMIAGTTDSIYFFDITDPSVIKLCARFWGTNSNCINRDYYPYHHYMYTVSDQCNEVGHLQIFDMQYLPDSVIKVHESDSLGGLTHTIFIEEKSQRMYMQLNKVPNKNTGQLDRFAMDIISIANPVAPRKIGTLKFPAPYDAARVHEAYVRNDTAYCSSENAGLFIFDVRDAANPVLLSAIVPPYPENAYNHSCWLDSSGRYILFTDETPEGKGMKIFDLKNITEPRLVSSPFRIEGSPHNAYWMGRYAYTSAYYGGVQVYDLMHVDSPTIGAYYDTYPETYTGGYKGCWGVWPFLPSGVILASDMQNGLFVFKTTEKLGMNEQATTRIPLRIYPNPAESYVHFMLPEANGRKANLAVYNLQGKLVAEKSVIPVVGVNEVSLPETLPDGLYMLQLITDKHIYSAQLVKQ